ncbi:alpha/beta hydrolase fold domain-containing protein [Inhella proteolytica]|uniref:Alpha/beta hydrolase fold domain-containing protein n=1 Tax=Inhella proteolytica TaxID=2795029 RepID=A0A931J2G3_9BURK|nr:alpha/beta hydrolase fold domain-containing protein [Inhella proteolytica]MBH9577091.1 alpha/beta hydrolase fold domain-containing protein [Inhella proteolytica]
MNLPPFPLLKPALPLAGKPWLLLSLGPSSFIEDRDPLPLARALAEAGARVQPGRYPLAPAHPFPAALDAAWAQLQQLAAARPRGARLGVAGVESGGTLAAALALRARDEGLPLGAQILVSPTLDPMLASAAARDAHLGDCQCPLAAGWRGYLGPSCDAAHPYATPLSTSRLQGLAPALLITGGARDPLRDDAQRYAERLRAAGVAQALIPVGGSWLARAGFPPDEQEDPDDGVDAWTPVSQAVRDFLSSA